MKRSYELEIILKNCCHKKSILQRFRSSSFPLNKSNPAEKTSWTNQICSQSVLQDHLYCRTKSHIWDPILLCTLTLNRFQIYIIAENVKLYTSRRSTTEAQNIKAMFIYHFSRIPLIKGFCEPPHINPL